MSFWSKLFYSPTPIPQEVVVELAFKLHICPDHNSFPPGHRRKEVGGCANEGDDAWIKGVLSREGQVMAESLSVLGHEVMHLAHCKMKEVENPDEETTNA